jgi:hypothetical protein
MRLAAFRRLAKVDTPGNVRSLGVAVDGSTAANYTINLSTRAWEQAIPAFYGPADDRDRVHRALVAMDRQTK